MQIEDSYELSGFFSLLESGTRGFTRIKGFDEIKQGNTLLVLKESFSSRKNLSYALIKANKFERSPLEARITGGTAHEGVYYYGQKKCYITCSEFSIPYKGGLGKQISEVLIIQEDIIQRKVFRKEEKVF